jgi:cytochrome P450
MSGVVFNPYLKETAHNPYPIYRELRDEAPVYHNDALNFWALSRHADVQAAHIDFETFSSAGGVTIEGYEKDAPLLIVKDPPEHTWHRKVVSRVFSPRRIAELEPFIRHRAGELLDAHRDAAEFDVVADFALKLPLDVISELIGIPESLRDEVHVLSDQVASREDLGETRLDEAEFETENSSLVELFLGLVKERHQHPRDDVITLIMDTPVVDDDGHEHVPDDVEIAVRF